jgi:hypothetical protein
MQWRSLASVVQAERGGMAMDTAAGRKVLVACWGLAGCVGRAMRLARLVHLCGG